MKHYKEYLDAEEVKKFLWADVIVWQMPSVQRPRPTRTHKPLKKRVIGSRRLIGLWRTIASRSLVWRRSARTMNSGCVALGLVGSRASFWTP